MVIGEIEPIMGHLGKEQDFEEIILQMWLNSNDEEELKHQFNQFGEELSTAKREYLKAKTFEEAIFGQDYEA